MLEPLEREHLRTRLRSAAASSDSAATILGWIRELYYLGKPADALLCATAVKHLAPRLQEAGARRMRAFIARSVSVEPILPFLKVEAALAGFALELEVGGYGSFMDELLNPGGVLHAESGYDLVIAVLDMEDIAGRLPELCASGRGEGVDLEIAQCVERIGSMLHSFRSRSRSRSRILLQGFVVPAVTALGETGESSLPGGLRSAVRRLNADLMALCRSVSDCLFFSVDDAAARFGKDAWFDPRLFYSSRVAVAPSAFPAYSRAMVRSVAALFRPARKVLCTDLDQTLWGGILGEDGPQGIATGTAFPGNCYRAYQQHLLRLRSRGILLAAVSKNNVADVEEAFTLRGNDLALGLGDFTARKIGWGEKVESLRELAGELSLGMDSFVFVDDNPVECEAVRQALPGVAVIQVPAKEPWRFVSLLEEGGLFDILTVTDDDLRRSEEYRNEADRESLRESIGDRDGFLRSLEIVCTFLPGTEAPLARSVQLLGKTNQFNLTTRRHSAADVEHFYQTRGGQCIALRVRDRFGDSGVVGLLLAETHGEICRIDTLLLSCRVIGRDIERALLAEAAARAERDGARGLLGEFRPTKKNGLCASFYADLGFVTELPAGIQPAAPADKDAVFYWYDLAWGLPASPAFLTLEGAAHELATASPVTA